MSDDGDAPGGPPRPHPIDDVWGRRARLVHRANPHSRLDYLVTLRGTIHPADASCLAGEADRAAALLRYVPDRDVLAPDALDDYFADLGARPWDSLEALATTFLEDVNNELVPRWVMVTLSTPAGPYDDGHSVTIEDRQPRWNNQVLLNRLERI